MKAITIFQEISGLNPRTSTISSIGTFISNQNQMVADMIRREIMGFIPENSLAYSILRDSNFFTEKQLWAISFELLKNENYCAELQETINERNSKIAFKKAQKQAKNQAVKTIKAEYRSQTTSALNICNSLIADQMVKHPTFGIGKVVFQDEKIITISFETVGEKKLLKAFSKLEKI